MKRIPPIRLLGFLILLFAAIPYLKAQKITLTPNMVTGSSSIGNITGLVDEQTLVPDDPTDLIVGANCNNSYCPTNGWGPGNTGMVDLTFPTLTTITGFYLLDGSGGPDLDIEYFDAGNWIPLATVELTAYGHWIQVSIPNNSIVTTKLRFIKNDQTDSVWEIALYGELEMPPTGKIPLSPNMVTTSDGVGNEGGLVDEQTLVPDDPADLIVGNTCANSYCPNNGWGPGNQGVVILTFPGQTTITDFFLLDASGGPALDIEYFSSGNWYPLALVDLAAYNQWVQVPIPGNSVTTTKLKFIKNDQSDSVWEIALYGESLPPSTEVTILIDPNDMQHETSSHIIGATRNIVVEQTQWIDGNGGPTYNEIINQYGDITPRFGNGRKTYRLGGSNIDGLVEDPDAPFTWDTYGYHFQNHAGLIGPYAYDDFDYFIDEALQLNSDMIVGVNVGSGSAEEAADMVQHLLDRGLLDQVAFFEMGTELMGNWQLGYGTRWCNPTEYATYIIPFISQMRAIAPNIKIAACGSYSNGWEWPDCQTGISYSVDQVVDAYLTVLGDDIDFIANHSYLPYEVIFRENTECQNSNGDYQPVDDDYRARLIMAASPWSIENRLLSIQNRIAEKSAGLGLSKQIKIVNTEYGTAIEHSDGLPNSMTEALYTGDQMLSSVKLDMPAANNFCLYHYGINIDFTDNIFFEPESTEKKPPFYVHQLVAENLGNYVVGHTVVENVAPVSVILCNNGTNYQYDKLSIVATKDADGCLRTMVVNRSEEDVTINIQTSGGIDYSGTLHSFGGDSFTDKPNQIIQSQINSLSGILIPKLSVNMLVTCDPICNAGESCCDDNPYTYYDEWTNDCTCEGVGPLPITQCNGELFNFGDGQVFITPTNENTHAISIEIDGESEIHYLCGEPDGTPCNTAEEYTFILPTATTLTFSLWDDAGNVICPFDFQSACTDTDGDGICRNVDCDEEACSLPGTPCSDGDPDSYNDMIQEDGCTCLGTPEYDCSDYLNISQSDGQLSWEVLDDDVFSIGISNVNGIYGSLCSGNNNPCIQNGLYSIPLNYGTYSLVLLDTDYNTCPSTVTISSTPTTVETCDGAIITTFDGGLTLNLTDQSILHSWIQGIGLPFHYFCNDDFSPASNFCFESNYGTVPLLAGDYTLQVIYDGDEFEVCDIPVQIDCTDSDQDGHCDIVDCSDNDPSRPAPPGSSCMEGGTAGTIQADGCTCLPNPTNNYTDCSGATITTTAGSISAEITTNYYIKSIKVQALGSPFGSYLCNSASTCNTNAVLNYRATPGKYTVTFDYNFNTPSCQFQVQVGSGGKSKGQRKATPSQSGDLSLFPNPNKGQFWLQKNKPLDQPCIIRVYNVLGELIVQQEMKATENQKLINLSKEISGIYLVETEFKDGQTFYHKAVCK